MAIHNNVITTGGSVPSYSVQFRLPTAEAEALRRAIYAYECAGYGSHVTQPLREALASVEFSISEVRS